MLLDEIARQGAQRMLMTALKWEADSYVERHRGERDEHGHALVVRNGRASTRGRADLHPGEQSEAVGAARHDQPRAVAVRNHTSR